MSASTIPTPGSWALRLSQLSLAAFAVALVVAPVTDLDIWWHLRNGEWILAHRALPTVDTFSTTGGEVVAYSWAFDVLLYGLHRLAGLYGLIAYRVVMVLAVLAALYRAVRRREPEPGAALALCFVALSLLEPVLYERSWMFTMLGCILTVDAILSHREGRPWALWVLPAVFALWANFHVQYFYGVAMLGFAALLDLAQRRRPGGWRLGPAAPGSPWAPWRLLGLSVLGTFVTPHGLRHYAKVLQFADYGWMRQWNVEIRSPPFDDLMTWCALFFALLALIRSSAALREERRGGREPWLEVGLLVFGLQRFLHYWRDTWMPTVFAATFLAGRVPWSSLRERVPRVAATALAPLLCVACLLGLVGRALPLSPAFLDKVVAEQFPERAAQAVERAGYPGPLYNHHNWGGFLLWRLPQYPVAMDGRLDIRTEAQMDAHVACWRGRCSDPAFERANLVIAELDRALTRDLARDPAWEEVYRDQLAAVFRRREQRPH